MTYEEEVMLISAKAIAEVAHAGQLRKDGSPYIDHPRRVAENASGKNKFSVVAYGHEHDIVAEVVGWLHDTVEDTSVTLDGLRQAGFSNEIVEAIDALTRRKGETYMETIERVAQNPIAIQVKLADLRDNLSDQSALDPDEAEFFKKRYTRAIERLTNAT